MIPYACEASAVFHSPLSSLFGASSRRFAGSYDDSSFPVIRCPKQLQRRPPLLPIRQARNGPDFFQHKVLNHQLDQHCAFICRNQIDSLHVDMDSDAESLSLAIDLAMVASEVKAGDICLLYVKPLVCWTSFFIIATSFSLPHTSALGLKIRNAAEKKFRISASGDFEPNVWTLLDFGDVVVHIFLPQQRAYYNLEEFYANAPCIKLPSN